MTCSRCMRVLSASMPAHHNARIQPSSRVFTWFCPLQLSTRVLRPIGWQEFAEIDQRIRCAWAAFVKHHQLTSKSYQPRHRLRLFTSVVSPSMMYGAETWNVTSERENQIRTKQKRMRRIIIQTNVKENESDHKDQDSSLSRETDSESESKQEQEEEGWKKNT